MRPFGYDGGISAPTFWRSDPTWRRACEGNGRSRFSGFNCGLPTPDPDHWPLCTGWRVGNWELDASPGLGPYSPDVIFVGGYPCLYVSAGLFRSASFSNAVEINAVRSFTGGALNLPGTVIGSYMRYYELVFTGDAAGDAILTAHTTSHPDPRFPPTVEWTNQLPLSESSILSLTTSTQFADDPELQPFLARSLVLTQRNATEHGTPYFDAGGELHAVSGDVSFHHDPLFKPTWGGSLQCHWPLTMEGVSRLCGTVTIDPWPIFCLYFGHPLTTQLNSLSGEIAGDGTAYDGTGGGDLFLGVDTALCNGASNSTETAYGEITLAWEADCEGVTLTATVSARTQVSSMSRQSITWTWTGLPFDWWRSTHTATGGTLTAPDGSTTAFDITITIALRDCDYYYEPPDPELEPCFDDEAYPMVVTIEDVAGYVVGGAYAFPWTGTEYSTGWTPAPGDGDGWQVRMRFFKNTTPEIHGDPADGVTCAPEGGWPGGVIPAGLAIWDLVVDKRPIVAGVVGAESTEVLQNTCVICSPSSHPASWIAGGTPIPVDVGGTDIDFTIDA